MPPRKTTPLSKARLAARAAEKTLDWQIAVAAYSFRQFTFFEAVDKVAGLGVDLIEGFNFQKISKQIPGTLNPLTMSDEESEKVRRKLQASGVTPDRAVLWEFSRRRSCVSNYL